MAKTTNLNVRLSHELKAEAEKVYAYHELSLQDAIKVFLKHSCYAGGFPFNLKQRWDDPVSLATLEECKQLENDPNAKTFSSVAEIMADLENDDD